MIDSRFVIPQVATEVGVSAALVFGRLLSWFWNRDVVFRTNEEIASDLEGMLSTSTIHRAKHRLIKAGLLTVTFDKGYKRTTFFHLTEKAIEIIKNLDTKLLKKSSEAVSKKLQGINKYLNQVQKVENEVKPKTQVESECAQEQPKKHENSEIKKKSYPTKSYAPKVAVNANSEKIDTSLNQGEANTDAMKKAFAEQGRVRPEKTSMPESLKALLNGQKNAAPTKEVSTANIGSLVSSVFKSGVSAAQKEIYNMTNQARNYVED